jgi:hypothetical protein
MGWTAATSRLWLMEARPQNPAMELGPLSGLGGVLDAAGVATILDRGFRGMAKDRAHWQAPVRDRRTKDRLTDRQRAFKRCQAGLRALVNRRSATWPTRGRCAVGAGYCTGSGLSSGPLAHWCALAAGCAGSPPE